MISFEDRKEGTCFFCKEMFNEEKTYYVIRGCKKQINTFSTILYDFYFHKKCWEYIAGDDWLIEEMENDHQSNTP